MRNIKKIAREIFKLAFTKTLKLHLIDENDDSGNVIRQLDKITDELEKLFDNIDVSVSDDSFSHGFGTRNEYNIVSEIGDSLYILLFIDNADKNSIDRIVKEFPEMTIKSKSKKVEFEKYSIRENVKYKTKFRIKNRINSNKAIIKVEWEQE